MVGGQVHNETVAMSLEPEEQIEETPGAKLKKLREDLQNQIAQRRSEQWLQKHNLIEEPSNDGEFLSIIIYRVQVTFRNLFI